MAHTVAAAAALSLLALQGCGSGGDDGKSTTTATTIATTTTSTSTTTTTTVEQALPLSGDDAAKYLNEEYMALKETNASSSIGVFIHMGLYEFFCHKIPALKSDCFKGKSDCMCSTSVYNHKMSLANCRGKGYNCFQAGLDGRTGMVFNSSMVHSKFAKCAYQYDGASDRRYNHGCGALPAGDHTTCDDKLSSFYNLDPATNEEVTDESDLVKSKYCPNHKPVNPGPRPADQCYYKGSAFFPPHEHPDELRKMIDQRLQAQKDRPDVTPEWNEVVLDVEAIYEELRVQPALVIPAMIWVKKENDEGWNKASLKQAQDMAAKMKADFQMHEAVPVVAVQEGMDVTKKSIAGPFVFDSADVALV